MQQPALWVQPKSQPKACDPIFAVWRGTDRLTQDLVWQRLDGAMAASQWVLARYLQRYLSGAKRTAAKAYYELRREPQRVAWRGAFAANSAENRAAIGYGIRRLAGSDAEKAAKAWAIFRDSHSFGGAERQMLDDHVAVGLAKIGQFPSTEQRPAHGSDFATQGLMNAAIAGEHWDELVYWISRLGRQPNKQSPQPLLASSRATTKWPTGGLYRAGEAAQLLRFFGRIAATN
jgi:soluble lytic murein transglycosylase